MTSKQKGKPLNWENLVSRVQRVWIMQYVLDGKIVSHDKAITHYFNCGLKNGIDYYELLPVWKAAHANTDIGEESRDTVFSVSNYDLELIVLD